MNLALRFTYSSGGTVYTKDFYKDEIRRLIMKSYCQASVERKANRKPVVIYWSDEYWVIDIEFVARTTTVITNLIALMAITDIMKMDVYYSDVQTVAESLNVVIDPNITMSYIRGGAKRNIGARFFEASSGDMGVLIPDQDIISEA